MRIARDERRAKLVAALALSLAVGVGTYTATYRALVLISTPATASVAPAKSESHARGPGADNLGARRDPLSRLGEERAAGTSEESDLVVGLVVADDSSDQ